MTVGRLRAGARGGGATHRRARAIRAALALGLCLLGTGDLRAQGISFSGSSTSPLRGVVLTEGEVLEQVSDSFSRETRAMLERMQSDRAGAVPQETIEALVRERTAEFMDAVAEALTRLAGDGVLHAQEVADELTPLRAERIEELATAVDAMTRGHPPPPVERHFDTRLAFARAMAHYTFVERNSARSLLAWAATVLAGLAVVWILQRLFQWLAANVEIPRWARFLQRALKGPLYLGAAALGVLGGLHWVWIPGLALGTAQEITHGVLILVGFWMLWNLCDALGGGLAVATEHVVGHGLGTHRRLIIRRIMRVIVVSVFLVVLIHSILDSNLTGLLAGLGVVGLALSFALRGSIENIAASFTIFGDEPFQVGDVLIYDDTWGTIEDIGFRSTRLRTFDNHLITIPNTKLVEGAVHNVGARGAIRRRFHIGLVYGTPVEKIREAIDIIKSILDDPEHMPSHDPPQVVFETFGDYDLRLLVQYHYQPPEYWEALEFDTRVNLQILDAFRDAGIEIAFPTMTAEVRREKENEEAQASRASSREDRDTDDAGDAGHRDRRSRSSTGARPRGETSRDGDDGESPGAGAEGSDGGER